MKKIGTRAAAAAVLIVAAIWVRQGHADEPPVKTVAKVDLSRYVGKWYEIASLPKFFQEGCVNTTATYSLRDDGDIDVQNRCFRDGEVSGVDGKAWVVDKQTNAKLKVRFFWPFSGDYWILALADDYSYALVGAPDRDSLWVLSRTPTMSEELYAQIMAIAKQQGFPVEKVERTPQSGLPPGELK